MACEAGRPIFYCDHLIFSGMKYSTNPGNSTATRTNTAHDFPIMLVQLQERRGDPMQLNEAVSARLKELLQERDMTQYQLYMKSGVPKSSIGNIVNCAYDSVKLRLIHEICQGLNINISDFFNSPYFDETNLEP